MQKGNKIMLIISLAALIAGSIILSRELSFRRDAVQTKGTVVSTLGSTFNVQYFTADRTEKIKRFTAKVNHNRVGDSKNVWYLPENPDSAKLSNGTQGGSLLLKVALGCLLLGIYPLFLKKREPSK